MIRTLAVVLLSIGALACSDDAQPSDTGPSVDGKKLADGKPVPTEARPWDTGSSGFPEARPPDQGSWKCTAGAANMCDGYKTQYCLNGVCTACPANKTDCDRTGDCECAGICDGTKCKMP